MTKGIGRKGRSSKLIRASTWTTWNPSENELDGTKKLRKHIQFNSADKPRIYSHSRKKVTLPEIKLPDYKDE